MDRGIWAIWYELPEDRAVGRSLDWFHGCTFRRSCRGRGTSGRRMSWATAGLASRKCGRTGARERGLAAGFLALGGLTVYLSTRARQLKARQDARTRG
jgi:hypothetical protein